MLIFIDEMRKGVNLFFGKWLIPKRKYKNFVLTFIGIGDSLKL